MQYIVIKNNKILYHTSELRKKKQLRRVIISSILKKRPRNIFGKTKHKL